METKPMHKSISSNKINPASEIDIIPPVEILRSFIKAMNKWELECWKIHSESKIKKDDPIARLKQFQESQERIFAKYCTPKKRVIVDRFGSFRNPPEYDPEMETILKIEEVSKRRVVIYTQQGTGFRNKCQYVLLRKGSQWLIDSKKIYLSPFDKWIRASL
jgi:hypothetical protein